MRKILLFCGLVVALCASTIASVRAQERAEVVIHDWLENGSHAGGFRHRVTKEGDEFVYWYEAWNKAKEDIHLRWVVLDRLIDDGSHDVISNGPVGLVISLGPNESKTLTVRSKQPPTPTQGTSCTILKMDVNSPPWRGFSPLSVVQGEPTLWLSYICGTGYAYVPRKEIQ